MYVNSSRIGVSYWSANSYPELPWYRKKRVRAWCYSIGIGSAKRLSDSNEALVSTSLHTADFREVLQPECVVTLVCTQSNRFCWRRLGEHRISRDFQSFSTSKGVYAPSVSEGVNPSGEED